MAMIKCPDCKTPISDTAECCPQCGCKFRAEYEEMLSLRSYIPELENRQYKTGAKPDGTAIFGLIFGGCIAVLGIWLMTLGYGWPLLGLAAIGLGGFIAFVGCLWVNDPIKKQDADNRYIEQMKERLPEHKRRLAELETKFR